MTIFFDGVYVILNPAEALLLLARFAFLLILQQKHLWISVYSLLNCRCWCLLFLRFALFSNGLYHLLGTFLVKLPVLFFGHRLHLFVPLLFKLLDERNAYTSHLALRFEAEGFKDARVGVF